MIKRQDGFSLVELLIVMALFVIVLAISTDTFTIILRQSSQQAKTAETQIESIAGLEMIRTDIEHAGYGLPWAFQAGINYSEAATEPCAGFSTNDAQSTVPRAILSCNNTGFNGSDYLVIKSTIAGMNGASQLWSYMETNATRHTWPLASDNLESTDRVIAIRPKAGETTFRQLVIKDSDGTFFTQYSSIGSLPVQTGDIIYGVNGSADLRMPFNRADYYIRRPADANMPSLCSPGSGILYKATVNHNNGGLIEYPLLDCVADMQLIFRRDTNKDGIIDTEDESLAGLDAQQIREQVKEVRVFILTHEGQRDTGYTYPNNTILVGNRSFNLSTDLSDTTAWQNYRWKVITFVVKPKNLQ